jgi:hypothetical protein
MFVVAGLLLPRRKRGPGIAAGVEQWNLKRVTPLIGSDNRPQATVEDEASGRSF